MHELSLAEGLIEQLEDTARNEGAIQIKRIVVVIGKYSGVECDAFEFAFPMAAEGSMAVGAELLIEEQPVKVSCRSCSAESEPDPLLIRCAACGADDVEIIAGRDFLIREVELEVP